ncbi:MAG: AraC family transcriptional regulator [Firmicutes bacterium]|nr:AraC family transcriptional regulator [Bacillota bacterium]
MEAWRQKNLTDDQSPFNLFITDVLEFPPHWHDEIEIIYVLEEELVIGLNSEIFHLKPRDIFLINSGEVHYFVTPPKKSRRIILQFELSLFQSLANFLRERKPVSPLIPFESPEFGAHRDLEKQLLAIVQEYSRKSPGYQLAIRARLYDLAVVILRQVPTEPYSSSDRNKHLKRLERLEQVFNYVEQNHHREITLTEIAKTANFSIYHFTRFFKETTGMTFTRYLNNYRINKAVKYLTETADPITEVAFKSGFESIKTFNRVFKQLKGCSPSAFKRRQLSQ